MITATVQSDPVPSSFCPIKDSDWQLLTALLHVSFSGDPSINQGSATPTPDRRDRAWIRSNTDGTPDRTYVFSNGIWRSRHPTDPGLVMMYTGTEASIDLLDGGLAGVVTSDSGPFWAKMAGVDARFPVQPGTLPISTILIPVGGTGGEDMHTLTSTELPAHQHLEFADEFTNPWKDISGANDKVAKGCNYDGAGAGNSYYESGSALDATMGLSSSVGGDQPHQNMPPYFGIWFVQRTARLYYTQPA